MVTYKRRQPYFKVNNMNIYLWMRDPDILQIWTCIFFVNDLTMIAIMSPAKSLKEYSAATVAHPLTTPASSSYKRLALVEKVRTLTPFSVTSVHYLPALTRTTP